MLLPCQHTRVALLTLAYPMTTVMQGAAAQPTGVSLPDSRFPATAVISLPADCVPAALCSGPGAGARTAVASPGRRRPGIVLARILPSVPCPAHSCSYAYQRFLDTAVISLPTDCVPAALCSSPGAGARIAVASAGCCRPGVVLARTLPSVPRRAHLPARGATGRHRGEFRSPLPLWSVQLHET